MILADSIGPLADTFFNTPQETAYHAWQGALLFSFQIYFDFSGYSDIAVGVAYLLGLRLPINFRTPYLSTGPQEFWRRWHISLSTWMRDYLYIPMGGGRGGHLRAAAVLLTTMGLAGLWHGANYTFVLWGVGWGLYILAARFIHLAFVPVAARWILHLALVTILWVFFRSPGLNFALDYLGTMLSFRGWQPPPEAAPPSLVAIGIAGLFLLHALEARANEAISAWHLRRWNHPYVLGLMLGLCVMLVVFPSGAANPFIYFRF